MIKLGGPEVETLVKRLKLGCNEAFKQLCLLGIPLANYLSQRSASRHPGKREDIYAAAHLGMFKLLLGLEMGGFGILILDLI